MCREQRKWRKKEDVTAVLCRDLYTSQETYKRDLYTQKRHGKETYIHQIRPTKETNKTCWESQGNEETKWKWLQYTATHRNTLQHTTDIAPCAQLQIQHIQQISNNPVLHLPPEKHCNTLQHTATHRIPSFSPLSPKKRLYRERPWHLCATHCNTRQHTATHGNTRQHTATHGNTRQHTATYCNTLQHTASYCNTLQHTATHCNTLKQIDIK